jgi:hypothetical protein
MDRNRMPNFFIIGAAKAGTTSLYRYLSQHPDVFLPTVKEPGFFNDDSNYRRGIEWYLRTHFARAVSFSARGDASAHYLYAAHKVAPRVAKAYPGEPPLMIAVLRDPVQRAYSHYWHIVKMCRETRSFHDALACEKGRTKPGKLEHAYFAGGLYGQQVGLFLQHFWRNRFLFVLFEDLCKDSEGVCRRIFDFLGVDSSFKPDISVSHNAAGIPRSRTLQTFLCRRNLPKALLRPLKLLVPRQVPYRVRECLIAKNTVNWKYPPMPKETERMLRARYREDILRLQDLIGRDLSNWL